MSTPHLEYSLSTTLTEVYKGEIIYCPEHKITTKVTSNRQNAHSKCRKIMKFPTVLFSELETTERLNKLVDLICGSSRKIHHLCGSIMHPSSHDIHVNACSRAPNSAIQAPKENNRKRRRIESSQSSQSNAQFLDSHDPDDEYALKVYHAQFEEELVRLKSFMCDDDIWEKFSHLTWEYYSASKMNSLSVEEFEQLLLLVAYYFCKYSRKYDIDQFQSFTNNYMKEFPTFCKILLREGFYELLKAGSFSSTKQETISEDKPCCFEKLKSCLAKMMGHSTLENPKSYRLPDFLEETEYSSWIGSLQDVLSRFSCYAFEFVVEIFNELQINLKDKLESINKKSVCIQDFINRGCPVDDADPYVVLCLLISEFSLVSAKFKNFENYVGKASAQIHKVSSLKNIRDITAHLGQLSTDPTSAPRRLSRPRILQTLCNIAELCYEMGIADLEEMINEKISALYPHRLMKIKIPKQISQMDQEEKNAFWNLMESAEKLGYTSIAIEFGSIVLTFYTMDTSSTIGGLLSHFKEQKAHEYNRRQSEAEDRSKENCNPNIVNLFKTQ